MSRGIVRSSSVLVAGVATVLALAGCFPTAAVDVEAVPGATESSTPTPSADDTPSQADPSIVVLTEDEVVPMPQWERSTPAGSWEVGPGIPPGFPAGVPVFPDRWIKNNQMEFDSAGRYGYSSMFWGGYDDMDQLRRRLDELGFDIAVEQDDRKLVILADSDRYRVVINGTETAQNPGEEGFIDPAYTIIVVVQD